ncbi:MAG: hypothetical protein KA248_07820 [Kiritimatiellae bacterium]|nr:hypothetical protein [Kiritimatiellia bacterium]
MFRSSRALPAAVRTGNDRFDGLYALAIEELRQNSVEAIRDGAYDEGRPIPLHAFQTGAQWPYVWTRDLAYAVHLALAQADPPRAAASLLFKTSRLKPAVRGGFPHQIVQDTGSGGSYPISTDRVVWLMGAWELLDYLDEPERGVFLARIYPFVRDTIEQDRRLIHDPEDGLYRGEQSFLDWREQTYPPWTADSVLPIGLSKAFGTNVLHFHMLDRGALLAAQAGTAGEAARYRAWADQLRTDVRRGFFDPDAGLHAAYLFSDGATPVRVPRRDLLGESLAILFGVIGPDEARGITERYPTGPHGPPVVWPQERSVPIYHNNAIWPFVTAYWMLAARKAGNAEAAAGAMDSLVRGAVRHRSNMENLDFVSGQAHAESHGIAGPVINSERQLWSVAGYLAMVQKVLFGLETGRDGIRFDPFLPARVRRDLFPCSNTLSLNGFRYRGKRIDIELRLPAGEAPEDGVYRFERATLNGRPVPSGLVAARDLAPVNSWTLHLAAVPAKASGVHRVDVTDRRALFGPGTPRWADSGIMETGGRLTLHFAPGDDTPVTFTIFRDGALAAEGVTDTSWTDPEPGDIRGRLRFYAVCAVDRESGNASHLTPSRYFLGAGERHVLPAREFQLVGGRLADGERVADWGAPGDEIRAGPFGPRQRGRFRVRARYANGTCPINTGITCGVKRLDVLDARTGGLRASGYLLMPGLGEGAWNRFEWSSPVHADLDPDNAYVFRFYEDEVSRNMSSLEHNRRYTALPGGGPDACNRVDLAAIEVLYLGPPPDRPAGARGQT